MRPQEEFDLFGAGEPIQPKPDCGSGTRPAPHQAPAHDLPPPPTPLSVGELTRSIRLLLEEGIGDVWVAGEVSNHRRQASGHQYFTLKDADAQIACVLFRGAAARSAPARLADGMQVEVRGSVSVYEARGQYQLIVRSISERGRGHLHEQFEAMKRKLEAEGIFAIERKKPLPPFPRRIALVTSPTGAAIRDMLDVLGRRAPWIEVLVMPVRVQGAGAAAEIAAAIERLDSWHAKGHLDIDLIIVGRGGGSLEDLWAFNEEAVARAIAACSLPVISAVGHETDFTIADFAADVRAPTPSAAAEIASPSGDDLRHRIAQLQRVLVRNVGARLRIARLELGRVEAAGLQRETLRRLADASLELDDLGERMQMVVRERLDDIRVLIERACSALRLLRPSAVLQLHRGDLALLGQRLRAHTAGQLDARRSQLDSLTSRLRLLGPQSALERGYSLTLDSEGQLITSALTPAIGSRIRTRFKDGDITSEVVPGDS